MKLLALPISVRCRLSPIAADTLYNLANLDWMISLKNPDELYRRSLEINPFSASTWHNYGVNLTALNRPLDAITPLKISLQLDASNPEVWCNLAWLIMVLMTL